MSDVSHLITDLKSILPESQVLSDRETLQASSHDTWPLSTKLRRLGCHDYQADVVVKSPTKNRFNRYWRWRRQMIRRSPPGRWHPQ